MTAHRIGVVIAWLAAVAAADEGRAAGLKLSEAPGDLRVFAVSVDVATQGKAMTSAGPGQTKDLPLQSTAKFAFRERRLPPAGRDAKALRAVREFASATMSATVDNTPTSIVLPAEMRTIVATGRREGLLNYSPQALLTRDQVDLLDMPGDPLPLIATLPFAEVEPGQSWPVPEWAAQMLTGIEAVESATMTGTLVSVAGREAAIKLEGTVAGLRDGAKTNVSLSGTLTYDSTQQYLSRAALAYTIKADVGSVAPGLEATVQVKLTRQPTQDAGTLTDALAASIPIEPPAESLRLVFDATPWATRLLHDRSWFVFHAVLDQPPKVAILRLVEQGGLVCQCNISPIPDAAPGTQTPVDQFQRDIQTVLGDTFRGFKSQQAYRIADGRMVIEVVATGEVQVQREEGAFLMPMEWHYYLCTEPGGRQISFVFALDPKLAPQLAGRDKVLVNDLQFLPVQAARK
jgi:hypothetical protein